jgi:hypothetical protein
MRVTLAIFLIIAFITPTFGQDVRKISAENVRSMDKIVQGAPFSAEAISESVQMLPDGNKITRRTVSRLYRDSEGRLRREDMPRQLGIPGAVVEMPPSITITDPVSGVKYTLNPKDRTFRQSETRQIADLKKRMEEKIKVEEDRIENEETRLKQELARRAEEEKKQENNSIDQTPEAARANEEAKARRTAQKENKEKQIAERKKQLAERKAELKAAIKEGIEIKPKMDPDPNSKTESLGVQNIEGIEAEGARTTTTIPAGTIGNDLPIEVVYERWYSPELQLVVLSKHSDPRFGVQTYRLTNITRSEQPITLFSPPGDYRPADEKSPKPPAALVPKAQPSSPVQKAPPVRKATPAGPMEIKKT